MQKFTLPSGIFVLCYRQKKTLYNLPFSMHIPTVNCFQKQKFDGCACSFVKCGNLATKSFFFCSIKSHLQCTPDNPISNTFSDNFLIFSSSTMFNIFYIVLYPNENLLLRNPPAWNVKASNGEGEFTYSMGRNLINYR